MKKNLMYAIVAVIVIIIVIVAAVFALGLIPTGSTPQATPTPTAATGVADASSIIFSSNITSSGTTTTYKWQGINIHTTANVTFRVDLEGGYSYILNVANETAFESTDGGVTWTTGDFATDWAAWGSTWQDYLDNLTHWNGTDATYTIDDATIGSALVFDISVNPTIPDSTFNA
jgi:archaellin